MTTQQLGERLAEAVRLIDEGKQSNVDMYDITLWKPPLTRHRIAPRRDTIKVPAMAGV